LVSPALFVLAGQLFDRQHTEFMVYLASRACLLPVWRSLFLFASLANAGLPLFPDFLAEFLLLQEVEIRHRDPMLFWLTPASMLAVVLSALPGAGLAVRFLVHLGLRSRATRLGIPILVARLA
jgi:NADH:ubiquinone oxidoreductase subunit 4 (subunit M)